MSFIRIFIILCSFLHGCVISDNIIKEGSEAENRSSIYIENGANIPNNTENHGIKGCFIKTTKSNPKIAPKDTRIINHIRNKRDTRNRNSNYGSFYDEYPRYEGIENRRPWHFYRAHERPNNYEATPVNREIEAYPRSLRKPPYERSSYNEDISHHIETRSSQLGNTRPDRQARPWPPRHGGPPYHEPPPLNREPFRREVPPPPPSRRQFPQRSPSRYEPPPYRNLPPRPPPQGPPQYRRPPLLERQFQPERPPPNWVTPNNRKPPPRDRNTPYRNSAKLRETSNIPAINSDIDEDKSQESTTYSDTNSSNAMDKIYNNQEMALENNYQNSTQSTRSHIHLFQAQPVTPEE